MGIYNLPFLPVLSENALLGPFIFGGGGDPMGAVLTLSHNFAILFKKSSHGCQYYIGRYHPKRPHAGITCIVKSKFGDMIISIYI